MREIPLTKGKVAIVDDEDYVRLAKYKWYSGSDGYARRCAWNKGDVKTILMHREILNTGKGLSTDHINGDRLDNRKENLRICSRAENNRNQKKDIRSKFEYKGIKTENKGRTYWARISVNNKQIYLGSFPTQLQAAKAYDQAAIKYYGEFARLNFPETKEVLQRSNQITLF